MKLLLLSIFLVTLASAQQYTTKYDNINLDEILSNKKVLNGYLNCVLDKGRCSVDGKELKSHIADALRTGCKKCTEPQKRGTTKVIRHLIKYEKEAWVSLQKKYDPAGTYAKKYERELKGI
ncbi:ejaculatory bulb-specific protein 3-like [Pieris napi]|uniref:ejaculatory bulb-specific protein 3-like n=1 Tax=Pieris napi TaxID=78633 RepID=UPI001FBA45D2|nr:ejaculatory bulb-specific protein 3-like [Pieris napi]